MNIVDYSTMMNQELNIEVAKRLGYKVVRADPEDRVCWLCDPTGQRVPELAFSNKSDEEAWGDLPEHYADDANAALALWNGIFGFSLHVGESQWCAIYQNDKATPSTVNHFDKDKTRDSNLLAQMAGLKNKQLITLVKILIIFLSENNEYGQDRQYSNGRILSPLLSRTLPYRDS
jgi:hypothetical protein